MGIVGYSAQEHADLVNSIPAETQLKLFNIFRHADFRGKRVVDLGCGDGSVARAAIDRGAEFVLGIDSHPDMIRVAQDTNNGYEDSIDYRVGFVEELGGDASFDIAVLSYLLNNAASYEQLLAQCKGAASCLRPEGVVVVYNNNPFDREGGDFSRYGFIKTVTGIRPGAIVRYDYRPAIQDIIINYYLSPQMHVRAFREAGFSKFRWEELEIPPGAQQGFWKDYFNRTHLPVIGMVAIK